MSHTSLSHLIRAGFEEALRNEALLVLDEVQDDALAMVPLRDLPRLMRDRNVPGERRDELLAAVIGRYRRSPHAGWSGVLLEMLSPALVRVCCRMIILPRGIDNDDLQQQVVLETLRAARSMPLHDPPVRMRRRIELRVATMTVRWLISVVRGQGESLLPVQPDPSYKPSTEDLLLVSELRRYGVSEKDLALLYRTRVLEQTFAELALEMGISENAVKLRLRRMVRRLRRRCPDLFGRFADDVRTAA